MKIGNIITLETPETIVIIIAVVICLAGTGYIDLTPVSKFISSIPVVEMMGEAAKIIKR